MHTSDVLLQATLKIMKIFNIARRKQKRQDVKIYDSCVLDIDRESWMSFRRKDGDLLMSAIVDSVRELSMRRATIEGTHYIGIEFSVVISRLSLSEAEMWLHLVAETDSAFSCAMRYLSFDDGMWRDKTAVFGCVLDGIEIYSDGKKPWDEGTEKERPFIIEARLDTREDEIDFAYVEDMEYADVEDFENLHSKDKINNRPDPE